MKWNTPKTEITMIENPEKNKEKMNERPKCLEDLHQKVLDINTSSSHLEKYYLEIFNLYKICKEIDELEDLTHVKVKKGQTNKEFPSKLDKEDFILTEFSLESDQYKGLDEIFSNLRRVLTESPLEIEYLNTKIEFLRNSFNNIDSRLREIKKICYIRRGINNLLRNCIKTSRSQMIENAAKDSIMRVNSIIIDLLKNRFLTVELEELD